MKSQEVLRLEDITKVYVKGDHKVIALQNVSCSLNKGEMVAIMGTSGSGKSTLLNIISALDKPTKGDLFVLGKKSNAVFKEPNASLYRQENIGLIFQSFQLLKDLNVEDNISLPLILNEINQNEIKKRVESVMLQLGIEKLRSHRPLELSGGQQQRVAIARAIISTPPILLADEPTGSLDFNTTKDIMNLLIKLKEENSQSILLVTHDAYVATYANRVLFFHDGKLVDEYSTKKSIEDLDVILSKFKMITRGGN